MKKILVLLLLPFMLLAEEVTDFEKGKELYESTCASCHGSKGETNPAMQLTVKPRQLNKSILSQSQMEMMIGEGGHAWGAHSDIMPAFKYVFEEEQIEYIALYVSKAFNYQRDKRIKKLLDASDKSEIDAKKMLRSGKKIFKRNCSLCHGVTGNGDSVYVEQSKANKQFLYPYDLTKVLLTEEQIFLYAKEGGHFWGTYKEDMPSWKKKYNDKKLRSVAKYIKEKIVKK